MSDPRRPKGSDPYQPGWSPPTEPLGDRNPPNADPAYAGQFTYPSYVPPAGSDATRQLPPYWTQTQYQNQPPGAVPPPELPEPQKSPPWLWLVAGAAVLLVIGLVVALVIANGSSNRNATVTPLPPISEPSAASTPPTTPRTTRAPSSAPTTAPVFPTVPSPSAPTGPPQPVVYSVSGEGRAINITYVDSGGMMQMEFNVVLPWSKEVSLESASSTASVSVLNLGSDVTCTVTVDGAQVQENTGTGLTVCAPAG